MCSTDGTTGYLTDGTGQAFNLSTMNEWFQVDFDGNSHLAGQTAEPDKGAGSFLVLNDTGSAITTFSLTVSDDFTSQTASVHACTGAQGGQSCNNFSAHGGSGNYTFDTELSGMDWDRCSKGTTIGQTCTGNAGGVAADFAQNMVTYTWVAESGKGIPAGAYFDIGFSGWNNDVATTQPPPPKGWSIVASERQPLDASVAGEINGIIYVAGGYDSSGPSAGLQAYNPATNTWAPLAPMTNALYFASAGVINGQLYVAGGQTSCCGPTDALFVYDPPSNTWTQKANMLWPSAEGTAGVIDDKLYVQAASTAFEVYDPAAGTWTALADAPIATTNGSSAVVNGKLYTTVYTGTNSEVTQVYDPASNTWTTLASMPTPVTVAAGAAVNGEFWVFGGSNGGCQNTLVQVYDPTQGQWSIYSPSMLVGLAYGNAEVVSGSVYVQGSSDGGGCNGVRGNNLRLIP